ncbi:MAG: superoxide dismutase [Pseudomonadota bacterium]
MLTRRTLLAAAAGALSSPVGLARAAAPFSRPPLAYGTDALAPHISERTLTHHETIHQGYFDALNSLVDGTPYADMALEDVVVAAKNAGDTAVHNNAAQAFNHIVYFDQFAGGFAPPGFVIDEALNREFGGLEGFADAVVDGAKGVFGTSWLWLTAEGDGLFLEAYEDAGNPLGSGRQILFTADLWEHAYYLDYQTDQAAHLRALVLELVNWDTIDQAYIQGG